MTEKLRTAAVVGQNHLGLSIFSTYITVCTGENFRHDRKGTCD